MLNAHLTMAEAFRQTAIPRQAQEALVCEGERLTYGQLLARVQALAQELRRLDLRKGDKAAALLPPGPSFACLFFALAEIGGVMAPLNPQMRASSLARLVEDAEPRLLALDRPPEAALSALLERIPHVILARGEAPAGAGRFLSLERLMGAAAGQGAERAMSAAPLPPVEATPDDPLALLYTSGTTGTPKGALHSHRSLIAPVAASLKLRELWLRRPGLKTLGQTAKALARYRTRLLRAAGRPQTFLSTVGWHTISGVELMLQGLLMGDKLIVMPHFHPRQALQLVEQERATVLVAIPTAFQMMLALPDFERYDTSSLLICGTGSMPCPPDLARQIQKRFGCAIHIGFGATETAGGIAISSISDSPEQQATTVGRPLPGMEVRIVDDQRRPLPPGQVGELACRSASIMAGYHRAPQATEQVIDPQGWYYTGDLAVMDEQGYLRIVGRKKEMIIRGGQNIYPAEIEAYLMKHPCIQEAAVVGAPSDLAGEQVWAFILLKPGAEMSAMEVLDFCRAELEPYQIPNQVRFVRDVPRAESGKVQKYALLAEILNLKNPSRLKSSGAFWPQSCRSTRARLSRRPPCSRICWWIRSKW